MKLIKPNIKWKASYFEMLEDWKSTNENLVPFSLKYDTNDFNKFIALNQKNEVIPDPGFVCNSTFWLVNKDDKIVGTSNIRHKLNDKLLIEGGHIGFGIRPSYRRKGYATKILELSLKEATKLGIKNALVTCNKSNIGSKKAILKNGGVFRKEQIVDGKISLSFWIDTKKSS